MKKCQSSIIYYCKLPILYQSFAKFGPFLMVMSDRTDTFRELWPNQIVFSIAINLKYDISVGDTDKSDVTVTFNIKEDLSIKLPLKDDPEVGLVLVYGV